ncbi:hypothetical protein D3C84_586340 [compost metagenome]
MTQAQRVEQGTEQAEFADETGERRHADDQQRAGDETQAQERHGPGDHLADHGFLFIVEVDAFGWLQGFQRPWQQFTVIEQRHFIG